MADTQLYLSEIGSRWYQRSLFDFQITIEVVSCDASYMDSYEGKKGKHTRML